MTDAPKKLLSYFREHHPTFLLGVDRAVSIIRYNEPCPKGGEHDWRYASHAPGWYNGDDCAFCQKCEQRAIRPKAGA